MNIEVSALFHLQSVVDLPVGKAEIGGGLFIERLNDKWIADVKAQCPRVGTREELEPLSPYTHRFFYEIRPSIDPQNAVTPQEKQLILWAITLSRIVKPTSVGYDSVWVKSFYPSLGTPTHHSDPTINNLNIAFVIPGEEDWNTITEIDAKIIAEVWGSLWFFIDNELKYRRLIRAIRQNEWAYSIWFPEIAHPTIHSALESLICAGRPHKGAQVTQRLPALVPFVSTSQATDIYETCCDFKHAAAAMLKQGLTSSGAFTLDDQRRIDSVMILRKAVRHILMRCLQDRQLAEVLCNESLLKQRYPVYDKRGKLVN